MSPHTDAGALLPFQKRVVNWLMACFSMEVCRDGIERNHRFLEESLELVQSLECTRSEAHQLVDYVFDRPVGEPLQELGGALVTLTALANCHDMDLMQAGETELARVWTKIDAIRAKQLAKPKHSPLPQAASQGRAGGERSEVRSEDTTIPGSENMDARFAWLQSKAVDMGYALVNPTAAQARQVPVAAALARRLCQMFDSGGESQRSARARHASAIFQILNREAPEYAVEQAKCDADPVGYLRAAEGVAIPSAHQNIPTTEGEK